MLVLCLTLLISLTVRWLMRGLFGIPNLVMIYGSSGIKTLYINISFNHAICIVYIHRTLYPFRRLTSDPSFR
jgi:hypothetical protein